MTAPVSAFRGRKRPFSEPAEPACRKMGRMKAGAVSESITVDPDAPARA